VIQRVHVVIRGAVQGVGFRPFVYRLATGMGLTGWVLNSGEGVFIEAQGEFSLLVDFLLRLQAEKPARSFIQSFESSYLDPAPFDGFTIRASSIEGARNTLVLPDIATCPDCLADIMDPSNRRYLYPFTNCTNCGPRFTIIQALPYDRCNTTMKGFLLCAACRAEYENPLDRRFHAQPTACPDCGPSLSLWNPHGRRVADRQEALTLAARELREGKIVAVKGLGGFHLMVDARDDAAVARLRARKRREEKPLALMFPDVESASQSCTISRIEERLLLSPESPIVLLRRRTEEHGRTGIAPSAAPGNPYLGVMLPYTPLHQLLLRELGFPLIATSGNISDEPICIDENEALLRLAGVADAFLVHNRPIERHVDDSIVRIMMGRELIIRRARGYAPLPLTLPRPAPSILAVGAHQKNTIGLSVGKNAFLSQHIGDLETPEAAEAFRRVIGGFQTLYEVRPETVAADMHPDYLSTRFAASLGIPVVRVQHHFAHVASCMTENELPGPVLGVAWDGTGYGLDGTIWGGEFVVARSGSFRRVGSLRSFLLPGSALAVKEPRRAAIGVLYELLGDKVFDRNDLAPSRQFTLSERAVLRQMLAKGLNSPRTSSAGRLFDGVASITGLRHKASFEGQAAMELEFLISEREEDGSEYPFDLATGWTGPVDPDLIIVDWGPLVDAMLADVMAGISTPCISARFHRTLSAIIVAMARRVALERVVLSGGCFQNRFLTEVTVRRLEAEGFRPYWHQRVPPNDGGIALGQITMAMNGTQKEE
jgi:hydrogenase maturation protein HypF